jgi:predicted acylesterase/phospholipase RssA
MCIPLVSKPIIIDGYYYVDGYLSNNLPYDIFINNNIPKTNILSIACKVNDSYEMPVFTQGDELTILQYYYNIALIYNINTFKLSYLNKLDNLDDILLIDVNNIKCVCSYDNINNCIDFSLSEEDINNLLFFGYKAIHDYMNEEK